MDRRRRARRCRRAWPPIASRPLAQQASPAWLGGGAAKALDRDRREFLKAQGRVPALAPDYGRFVTGDYVRGSQEVAAPRLGGPP